MSWLFSRALVEEYSAESSSDGAQFVRSKLIRMQQASSRRGKTTAACIHSRFGTTYGRSMGGPGAALLTWFLAASRARTSAQQAKAQESPEAEAGSGEKWRGSLAKYDPVTRSWKTHQFSLLGGLEPFSGTWPRWGMMRNGECWEQSTRAPHIEETGSGYWPTPRSCSAMAATITPESAHASNRFPNLETMVGRILWPKPVKMDALMTPIAERVKQIRNGQSPGHGGGCRNLRDYAAAFTNTKSPGLPKSMGSSEAPSANGGTIAATHRGNWWSVEPRLGRVAYGVADRVDRLKCLGNGQVPAVVKLAWETLSK